MDKHESTEEYKKMFATMMEEELLVGAPVIVKGDLKGFFRR